MKEWEKNAVIGAFLLIIGIFLLAFGYFNTLTLIKNVSIFSVFKLSEVIDQLRINVVIMATGIFLFGSGVTASLMSFDIVRKLEEKIEHKI
jgi:uncharacterized membrane protein YidH (DUF202 family)